jgi:hypothetical protein
VDVEPQVECPFCLSQISGKAAVCRYCARDVGRLLVEVSRVRELEAQLAAAATTTAPPAAPARAKPRVDYVVLGFYAVATLLYWFLIPKPPASTAAASPRIAEQTIDLVAVLAGVSLAFAWGEYNPWRFLVLGFAQPILTNIVLVLMNVLLIDDALALAPVLFQVAIKTGGLMTAGGALMALAARTGRTRQVTVDTSLVRLHAMNDPDFERLAKIVLMITTIATPIISLLALWKNSSKP